MGECGEAGEDVIDVAGGDEVGVFEELLAVPEEVEVGVAEAGGDGFAVEVEEFGVGGGEALCGGVVSCVEDFAVVDGHGGGARAAGVEGDEVGVGDDEVCDHLKTRAGRP